MMEKILTICVPTYNMEALLPRCLDSFIIEEEFMNRLEIIVVNDGSKDRSSEIAHQYEAKYPNSFIVIDKPNGNYGSCVNAALKIARGKYFRICDADDYYISKNLSDYISLLESINVDEVFSPYRTLGNNGKIIRENFVHPIYKESKYDIDNIDWSAKHLNSFIVMHCTTTKTRILTENSYFQTEGISYTDTQFVFYSTLYAKSCYFTDKTIYCYILGREGQTMSNAAMARTHMHFLINAEKMLMDYKNQDTISSNRQNVLLHSLASELSSYINFVLGYIYNPTSKIELFNKLVYNSQIHNFGQDIEPYLLQRKIYFMWKKLRIHHRILYYLMKFKTVILNA